MANSSRSKRFASPFSSLSAFLRWLTHTHTQRWHAHHHTAGTGHLYQGRFKSFPIQEDDHLKVVLRYVERNPLRAGLVQRAEDWRWSSLAHRRAGDDLAKRWLLRPPVVMPRDYLKWVNEPQTDAELKAVRESVARSRPFGAPQWQQKTADKMGLRHTLRPRGRPKKEPSDGNGV